MRKLYLIITCAALVSAAAANEVTTQDAYDFLPDPLGEIYSVPIAKAGMIAYYTENPAELPDEWLPAPFYKQQAVDLALKYMDIRETELGAEVNQYLPSEEFARRYLTKVIDNLSESDRAEFDRRLAAANLSREQYLERNAKNPAIQKKGAESVFMDDLATLFTVTEDEVREIYERERNETAEERERNTIAFNGFKLPPVESFASKEEAIEYAMTIYQRLIDGEDFHEVARTYGLNSDYEEDPDVVKLSEVEDLLRGIYNRLAINEVSKPFIRNDGKLMIIRRVAIPPPSWTARGWQIRRALEEKRAGNARSQLHKESGFKTNFKSIDLTLEQN